MIHSHRLASERRQELDAGDPDAPRKPVLMRSAPMACFKRGVVLVSVALRSALEQLRSRGVMHRLTAEAMLSGHRQCQDLHGVGSLWRSSCAGSRALALDSLPVCRTSPNIGRHAPKAGYSGPEGTHRLRPRSAGRPQEFLALGRERCAAWQTNQGKTA